MNDSEEYYCFRVKESVDSDGLEVGDNTVIIPRSYNFDLRKLRTELVSRVYLCPRYPYTSLFVIFQSFSLRASGVERKYIKIDRRVLITELYILSFFFFFGAPCICN